MIYTKQLSISCTGDSLHAVCDGSLRLAHLHDDEHGNRPVSNAAVSQVTHNY